MFRAIFAHLQERKTEIFTAYGILPLSEPLPTTTTGYHML